VSKLLLRHGIVYSGGHPWNGVHETWLRGQRFDQRGIQLAFDADLEAMLLTLDRRYRLDKAITEIATTGEYAAVVRRLGCLLGVSTLDWAWSHDWSPHAPQAACRACRHGVRRQATGTVSPARGEQGVLSVPAEAVPAAARVVASLPIIYGGAFGTVGCRRRRGSGR
jgi:hypothetical protein